MRKLCSNWSITQLDNVVEILDSARIPVSSDEREERIAGKELSQLFPYYGATGQVGYIDNYIFDGSYILLGEDGAPFLDPYKYKAYIAKGQFWVNNHAHILKAIDSLILPEYLCYYLNNIDYRPFIGGTTRLKLTQSSMKQIPIILPPRREQRRIVAKIEELFPRLDAGIEAIETAKLQIKRYRQAVLNWAFNGKFTNSTVKETKLLGQLIEEPRYGTSKKCVCEQIGKAVLRIPNIGNRLIDKNDLKYAEFEDKEIESLSLKVGDILIIRSNGSLSIVGKAASVREVDTDCLFAGYLIRIRIKSKDLNSNFLLYYLLSPKGREYIELKAKSTSGVNNINSDEIKGLKIPIFSLDEQIMIAQEIESCFSVCDKIEETIEQSLKQTEKLRQSILKKAFEGKLVAQDPTDEPVEIPFKYIIKK